jgi:hypothetical protein
MSNITRLAAVIALTVGVTACEAQCSVSTASLSEESMTTAVHPETKAPVAQVTSFAPDTANIYATAKLSTAPADTKIKAAFHYLEGGDRLIAEDEVTADGTRYVMFTLSPPTNGWPAGQYETRFFLNGKEGKRLPFNVTARAAAAPAPATSAAPASKPAAGMKKFYDEKFGFRLELPETFAYRVTPQKDYMFEGPKGSDSYELSILMQFVAKSLNPGSSSAAQLNGLAAQLAGAPNAAITTRNSMEVGGVQAPFVTVTYNAKDTTGVVVPFTHTVLVVDHGPYYYVIAYSGPTPIFRKYMPVFERMIEGFTFTS